MSISQVFKRLNESINISHNNVINCNNDLLLEEYNKIAIFWWGMLSIVNSSMQSIDRWVLWMMSPNLSLLCS